MGSIARVSEFLESEGISKYKFYQTTGLSNGFLDKGENMGTDKCEKIISAYPQLNLEWLITGHGDMTKPKREYSLVPTMTVMNDQNTDLTQSRKPATPLVNADAFAGMGNSAFAIEEKDIQALYVVPDFENVDFMIRVKGSSMYPKYNSGDVVACRILKERAFIQWNNVHVIATAEQGILIKRLKKGPDNNTVTAISDNKDYDPFDIPWTEVTGIALVVGVIRVE